MSSGERHWHFRYQDSTDEWHFTGFRDVMDILRTTNADSVIVVSDDEVFEIGAQSGRPLHYKLMSEIGSRRYGFAA